MENRGQATSNLAMAWADSVTADVTEPKSRSRTRLNLTTAGGVRRHRPRPLKSGDVDIVKEPAMYGVPEQLDLAPFVGTTLENISLAKFQIQFIFGGDPWAGKHCVVAVEGYWEMRDAQSALIDKAIPPDERDVYKLHQVLGRTVTATQVKPPESFTLIFDNGWTLTFVDDSPQYESCHVYIGDNEIHI